MDIFYCKYCASNNKNQAKNHFLDFFPQIEQIETFLVICFNLLGKVELTFVSYIEFILKFYEITHEELNCKIFQFS